MKPKPLTIGVAGGSGSGKSTVVAALMEAVGQENVALLPHDAYYRPYSELPLDDRRRLNWDHPERLETELVVRHLSELAAGSAIERPVYDFNT
jgi:uridine kinase